MTKIEAIIQTSKFEAVKNALHDIGGRFSACHFATTLPPFHSAALAAASLETGSVTP